MAKPWYQSKTLWLGVIMCLGAIAEYIIGLPVGVSITQMISGILTIIARFITNTPVSLKRK